jgi:hypothetical protein
MKNLLLLALSVLFLAACGSNEDLDEDNQVEVQEEQSEPVTETLDSATVELIEWDQNYNVYQGNYFSIEYPSNFTASPLGPKESIDNYEFIDTDEATFTSPNGEVEFFVYSPLWGGEPKSYLQQRENEEITTEKESIDDADPIWSKTIKWVTYTDKEGKYSRSYVSTKTESTDLVFGIKSVNDEAYKKYKAAYLRFKESLTQFADA